MTTTIKIVIVGFVTSSVTHRTAETISSVASWIYSIRVVNTFGTSPSIVRNIVGMSAFK